MPRPLQTQDWTPSLSTPGFNEHGTLPPSLRDATLEEIEDRLDASRQAIVG